MSVYVRWDYFSSFNYFTCLCCSSKHNSDTYFALYIIFGCMPKRLRICFLFWMLICSDNFSVIMSKMTTLFADMTSFQICCNTETGDCNPVQSKSHACRRVVCIKLIEIMLRIHDTEIRTHHASGKEHLPFFYHMGCYRYVSQHGWSISASCWMFAHRCPSSIQMHVAPCSSQHLGMCKPVTQHHFLYRYIFALHSSKM
jgi:hypothetical protein